MFNVMYLFVSMQFFVPSFADREVSPKFTLGRKKYGRRSRPASVVEDDDSTSCDVSMHQNFTEQTPHSSPSLSVVSFLFKTLQNRFCSSYYLLSNLLIKGHR